ncbi:MAG: ABC transporter ATP-binding protein [Fibrobacterales bacterium]|nr:ABC transporter ATP-binding protein [Fibrobacterales bacterium]MBP5351731.1 ABC transporter ATP-binding protein [Fibrobacterales bacterium]
MSEALLEARGIRRVFRETGEEVVVLDGVDFRLERGDFVTITGSSGSGKSTFLNILGSLDHPTEGTLLFEGKDLFALRASELDRFRLSQVGFVFQFHHLLPEMTAFENIMLPARILGTPERKARDRARELLTAIGLGDRRRHLPGELSGGERQRIAVARALMNEPKVVLADEPSGNLDERHSEQLHEMFVRLNREFGQSFVVVTHDLALAAMAPRRLVMHDGRLLPVDAQAE